MTKTAIQEALEVTYDNRLLINGKNILSASLQHKGEGVFNDYKHAILLKAALQDTAEVDVSALQDELIELFLKDEKQEFHVLAGIAWINKITNHLAEQGHLPTKPKPIEGLREAIEIISIENTVDRTLTRRNGYRELPSRHVDVLLKAAKLMEDKDA